MSEKQQLILMDSARVHRTAKRMAFELAEHIKHPDKTVICGLNKRGYAFAGILSHYISDALSAELMCHQLDMSSGADPQIPFTPGGSDLILADDVLFSGSTMMRALSAVLTAGQPERIKIAVLIDRGHRRFPLYPEVTGMVYPTKFREHVEVDFGTDSSNPQVLLSLQG